MGSTQKSQLVSVTEQSRAGVLFQFCTEVDLGFTFVLPGFISASHCPGFCPSVWCSAVTLDMDVRPYREGQQERSASVLFNCRSDKKRSIFRWGLNAVCCALFPDVHDEYWGLHHFGVLTLGCKIVFSPCENKEGGQCWSGVRLEKASLKEAREGFPIAGNRRGEARILSQEEGERENCLSCRLHNFLACRDRFCSHCKVPFLHFSQCSLWNSMASIILRSRTLSYVQNTKALTYWVPFSASHKCLLCLLPSHLCWLSEH